MANTVVLGGIQTVQTMEDGKVLVLQARDGELSLSHMMDGEAGSAIQVVTRDYPVYEGPVEVTPAPEAQILRTAATTVLSDIVINPIPNNYGLITWDGSVLTVS